MNHNFYLKQKIEVAPDIAHLVFGAHVVTLSLPAMSDSTPVIDNTKIDDQSNVDLIYYICHSNPSLSNVKVYAKGKYPFFEEMNHPMLALLNPILNQPNQCTADLPHTPSTHLTWLSRFLCHCDHNKSLTETDSETHIFHMTRPNFDKIAAFVVQSYGS
jgi:hypothetical protein